MYPLVREARIQAPGFEIQEGAAKKTILKKLGIQKTGIGESVKPCHVYLSFRNISSCSKVAN
jgi:hypothetical protein